ncbi:MAG: pitrilysin family protein [Pseudomonadota bacterium]
MIKHAISTIFVSLLIWSSAASAQSVDIPYDTFILNNGLRVVVHEDRKAPIVTVSVWYHVGSKDEPEGKTGFAHLFEHLMFNGSENHDAEYFEPLEQVGATSLNGSTWFDRTNYYQDVPTPALELALFLESDRMGHLLGAITQEKLDNQRGVVQNEKRQGDNSPYGLAEYRTLKGLYPEGHPYRWSTIGSMEDLNAASIEDVKDWFRRFYGPNNAVIVLAGDIDLATAKPLMQQYFGDIPPGPPLPKLQSWVPELSENIIDQMYDRVPQVRIQRMWNLPGLTDRDTTEMSVVAGILGSGKNSRMYKKLVIEEQVATSVYVSVQPLEVTSPFEIQALVKQGVDPARVNALIGEVLQQFLEDGPTKTELKRIKTKITAARVRGLEKVGGFGGKAVTLARGMLYADDPGFYKTSAKWFDETTRKSLKAVANKWLTKGYYQLTVVPFEDGKAASEGVDRSSLPAVAAAPDIDFPDTQRAALSNGIEVVFAQRSTIPVVQVALQFDAGYASDQGGKLGLADIAMAMLDEGTKNRTALEIASDKELLGAQIGAGSGLDTSTVSLSALKANLEPSLDLFADIVRAPSFPAADLERVRGQAIAGIKAEEANPQSIGLRLLPPLLYGADHPYGVPFTGSGTADDLAAISRGDLIGFHSRWIRPDNATLFVVGDTTLAEILPLLDKRFGTWKAPSAALGRKSVAEVKPANTSRIIIVDRPGSPQSLILGGLLAPPTGSDNTLAISAMNDVLGGAFTARVNMNLREEKGWAYGAYTFFRNAKGQRPYMIYAPVQSDKTAESLSELLKEMQDFIGDRPATPDELTRVVNNSSRALPGQFETAGSVLGVMMRNKVYGRPDNYVETLPGQYRELTLKKVMAAAFEVVAPQRVTWLIMGDAAQIKAPLEALGVGEVTVQSVRDETSAR